MSITNAGFRAFSKGCGLDLCDRAPCHHTQCQRPLTRCCTWSMSYSTAIQSRQCGKSSFIPLWFGCRICQATQQELKWNACLTVTQVPTFCSCKRYRRVQSSSLFPLISEELIPASTLVCRCPWRLPQQHGVHATQCNRPGDSTEPLP